VACNRDEVSRYRRVEVLMPFPTIEGLIRRRVLVNFRVDPEVIRGSCRRRCGRSSPPER
jgi:hypothetical protein